MTYRLVGLMSLVLLLSLAAFALLMNSYQAEVMDEVTRTVSRVGRATLRTFEFPGILPPGEAGLAAHDRIVIARHGYSFETRSGSSEAGAHAKGKGEITVIHSGRGLGGSDSPPDHDAGAGGSSGESPGVPVKMIVVKLESVHAETDPATGTVLRIPAAPVETPPSKASPGKPDAPIWMVEDGAGSSATKVATRDIVLPIPTHEFSDLFAVFKRRTLLLFLGVFMVGSLLSASLAARFTRPVRRLDAGIRRLSEGDLEVQVDEGGGAEIGRLARAFNEMARRLRAGRDRERELRRREKLSALGRLAAGVAHDVRNPLHSIGLTLQNLQETARPTEPDRQREFERSLAIIREEIRRLDRLVENFLRFARSDRAARSPVDPVRLLRETAQLVEKEAQRRGVRLRIAAGETVSAIEGEVEALRSSILNLVLNSFEAMPEGGVLTLAAREAAGEVVVEVVDTGRGIPEEDQERVFDFAYTTREDGHGLGLAMVHQVVAEDHGGRVTLDSRPGEGTRVLLAFPRPAGAAGAAS